MLMTIVASATLLAQPQTDPMNTTILWIVIGVLVLIVAALLWRTIAGRTAPAPTAPAPQPVAVKPSCEPLRLLRILQRDGRLIDFLLEDVDAYTDEQIGAAVRDIHRSCRKALMEHLALEPILPESEGTAVTVPAGFDPSAVRVTGNVTGQPPYTGTLRHHGWRVKELRIAAPPAGQDEFVVHPAEVEV
jgi:hypothetical protein